MATKLEQARKKLEQARADWEALREALGDRDDPDLERRFTDALFAKIAARDEVKRLEARIKPND